MGGQREKRLKDYDIPHLGMPSLGPAKTKGYPAESWGIKGRKKSVSGIVRRHVGKVQRMARAVRATGRAKEMRKIRESLKK